LCTVFVTNTGASEGAFNLRIVDNGAAQVEQDGMSVAPGTTVEAVLPYIAVPEYVSGPGSAGASCFIEPVLGSTLVLAQYQGNYPSSIMSGGILPAWAE
jgi:hypothetical protein